MFAKIVLFFVFVTVAFGGSLTPQQYEEQTKLFKVNQRPAGYQQQYILADTGQTCWDACKAHSLNCDPQIVTNNSSDVFKEVGATCVPSPAPWWAEDQPSVSANGSCYGYVGVPAAVSCSGYFPTSRRVCACYDPSENIDQVFGTGYSNFPCVPSVELTTFSFILPDTATYGVITHWWATAIEPLLGEEVTVRFYVDDEENASIVIDSIGLACGTGFNDDAHAPWGTEWFGKGAHDGSWFLNFQIPFTTSIRQTMEAVENATCTAGGGVYTMVRGTLDIPIVIGTVSIPLPQARLYLINQEKVYQPLDFVPLFDIPNSAGLYFMSSIAVQSGSMNFLEGCFHLFSPYDAPWPGVLLSTGTEDYYDSGWYFDGGQFIMPISGCTHLANNPNNVTWSAYRFHTRDPMSFTNGARFFWRNGDTIDPAGIKCLSIDGEVVGTPTESTVKSYAWVYLW